MRINRRQRIVTLIITYLVLAGLVAGALFVTVGLFTG